MQLAKHLSMDVPHVMDLGIAIKPNIEVFMGIKPEITVADPGIQTFRLVRSRSVTLSNKYL